MRARASKPRASGLRFVHPADARALAAMIDPADVPAKFRATCTPAELARRQIAGGRSWQFVDVDGAVVACAGVHARGDLREAWFACHPQARGHVLEIIRWAQLTFAVVAQSDGVDITARVAVGHAPGQRLARLAGFVLVGVEAGFETWAWRPDAWGRSSARSSGTMARRP